MQDSALNVWDLSYEWELRVMIFRRRKSGLRRDMALVICEECIQEDEPASRRKDQVGMARCFQSDIVVVRRITVSLTL
ncbi:hypothetical protein AMTR_s00015p00200740 [Amborella trichopoda]|uniref:Uncharacterized protein n=1 Tax=Amborella trichopoda TaxID=13333 RepID=W1PM75_AMBTC|nr:hypothetical protein AMTR_s00015p00200740 [Amborella trichopoda]